MFTVRYSFYSLLQLAHSQNVSFFASLSLSRVLLLQSQSYEAERNYRTANEFRLQKDLPRHLLENTLCSSSLLSNHRTNPSRDPCKVRDPWTNTARPTATFCSARFVGVYRLFRHLVPRTFSRVSRCFIPPDSHGQPLAEIARLETLFRTSHRHTFASEQNRISRLLLRRK